MRQFLRFVRIARDLKTDARESVKMRHFRAKSQHLDTLQMSVRYKFQLP